MAHQAEIVFDGGAYGAFVPTPEVTLNGAIVPVWLSGVAFVAAGALAVLVCRESCR